MHTPRFKVATLLMAGFGTVCVFLAAVIALGLSEQGKLNAVAASMAGDRWPRIELATDVRLRVTDIAVALRNMMLTDDPAVRRRQIDDIAAFRSEIDANTAELDRRVVSPGGRAALQQVVSTLQAYAVGQQELIAMVQSGREAEARAYLNERVKPMLQACRDAMAGQIRNEVALMNASREEAVQAYAATRYKMLGLGALALLCSAALAALIIGRLRRDLGGEPGWAAAVAARIAEGDLTGAIALRPGDRSSMMYEMEHMRDHLGHLVGLVRRDADQIAAASAQIAAGNLDLSARTEQQAASLEETAAAMEQLSATVEQNSANADAANSLAQQASAAAERGGEAVAAVTASMDDITRSAKQMAEIIGLIDGIAFQTNILSLNAAVEAARAGDAGRGFAVVASEVRQLAQRSAAAAQQIGQLITTATGQAHAGAAMVAQTGGAMRDIIASVARVEAIMAQIRHASAEQHSGIVACSRAVVEMDQGTQQNAALVEQVAAAAQSMQDQAGQLALAVSRFRIEGAAPAQAASRLPVHAAAPSPRVARTQDGASRSARALPLAEAA
ncbi:MAG TPA: methyl-accepting chemotaxis protein [Burkholderiaceae bacterium]|nr:methyl-accepting chemotaxis protein [Burkholderiaceae bacterium]